LMIYFFSIILTILGIDCYPSFYTTLLLAFFFLILLFL